jgi:hypothetical protein
MFVYITLTRTKTTHSFVRSWLSVQKAEVVDGGDGLVTMTDLTSHTDPSIDRGRIRSASCAYSILALLIPCCIFCIGVCGVTFPSFRLGLIHFGPRSTASLAQVTDIPLYLVAYLASNPRRHVPYVTLHRQSLLDHQFFYFIRYHRPARAAP